MGQREAKSLAFTCGYGAGGTGEEGELLMRAQVLGEVLHVLSLPQLICPEWYYPYFIEEKESESSLVTGPMSQNRQVPKPAYECRFVDSREQCLSLCSAAAPPNPNAALRHPGLW